MDNTQNIVSFCTGYAGLELGIKQAGENIRTICYVERDSYACGNLVQKIEAGTLDTAPVWTDVKTFPAEYFRGKVHGITAGYPCQPFSLAGRRNGTDDPRHLWPHICRHIETIKPVWFFGENVPGHLSLGFDEVYRSLAAMGYAVEAGIFSAAEVGAPHQRKRLFILAHAESDRPQRVYPSRERRGESDVASGDEVLGHTQRGGLGGQSRGWAGQEPKDGREELANASKQRLQGGQQSGGVKQQGQAALGTVTECGGGRWPARPGQPQHDWEPPRTIKPGLGRTIDGVKTRVDRLRLIGNGVVPQTAALAWRTLSRRIIYEKPKTR